MYYLAAALMLKLTNHSLQLHFAFNLSREVNTLLNPYHAILTLKIITFSFRLKMKKIQDLEIVKFNLKHEAKLLYHVHC